MLIVHWTDVCPMSRITRNIHDTLCCIVFTFKIQRMCKFGPPFRAESSLSAQSKPLTESKTLPIGEGFSKTPHTWSLGWDQDSQQLLVYEARRKFHFLNLKLESLIMPHRIRFHICIATEKHTLALVSCFTSEPIALYNLYFDQGKSSNYKLQIVPSLISWIMYSASLYIGHFPN